MEQLNSVASKTLGVNCHNCELEYQQGSIVCSKCGSNLINFNKVLHSSTNVSRIDERKLALLEKRITSPPSISVIQSNANSPIRDILNVDDGNKNENIATVTAKEVSEPIKPITEVAKENEKVTINSEDLISTTSIDSNKKTQINENRNIVFEKPVYDETNRKKRPISTQVVTLDDSFEENSNSMSYDGFHGKYSRASGHDESSNQEFLNSKVGPKQATLTNWFSRQDQSSASHSNKLTSPPTSVNHNLSEDSSPVREQPKVIHNSNKSSAITLSTATISHQQNIQQLQNNIQDLRRQLELVRQSKDQNEGKISRLEADVKSAQESIKVYEDRNKKLCKHLEQVCREMAIQDARRKRDKLALDCVRLGKITAVRSGPTFNVVNETWEEGYAVKDLSKRYAEHLEKKEELEKRKRKLLQMKRQAKKSNITSVGAANGTNNTSNLNMTIDDEADVEFDLDLVTEADAIRSHLEQLKRDEQGLAEEKKLLDTEKAVHQKELKRCQSEERSRFYRDLPLLHSRYLLISMLGRGGFSEVWKALDLLDLKEVAVKIHQLNPAWTEERKQSYIKHVTREYTIHREMKHPRVVQLFDVFEIDVNSFATVLEYCKGIDLDEKLKRSKIIPEKEARTILLQILSGLKYLNTPTASSSNDLDDNVIDGSNNHEGGHYAHDVPSGNGSSNTNTVRRKAVIHFDLKPANILFDEMGDAKITDFGLSKIIDDVDDNTSMELTSQGAGTYWYLPPECFAKGDAPPRISSKVDVWSLGVIFYQMLYGKRPFGEGKSQEKVLSEGIILNANRVEFPLDPKGNKISEEAKELIRACLTADQRYRPDVHALCQFPFLRNPK